MLRGFFIPYWYPCAKVKGFEIFVDGVIHFIHDLMSVRLLWGLCLNWSVEMTLFVYICISCSALLQIGPVFFCAILIWYTPTPVMVFALLIYTFCGSRPDRVHDRNHWGALIFSYVCDVGQLRGITLVNPMPFL